MPSFTFFSDELEAALRSHGVKYSIESAKPVQSIMAAGSPPEPIAVRFELVMYGVAELPPTAKKKDCDCPNCGCGCPCHG